MSDNSKEYKGTITVFISAVFSEEEIQAIGNFYREIHPDYKVVIIEGNGVNTCNVIKLDN